MTLRPTLIVFSRAPRLGAVKTRLARDIGAFAAWQFYRRTADRVLHRVSTDERWSTVVAVTPDRFRQPPTFWPDHVSLIGQGEGDLGERMERVLMGFGPGPAIVIGCDIPALQARHVAEAFNALCRHDVVFGPATDGGYWLVGVRQSRFAKGLFRSVRWSCEHTLDDTLVNTAGMRAGFAATLADVDTGADLKT